MDAETAIQMLSSLPDVKSVIKLDIPHENLFSLRVESLGNKDIREDISRSAVNAGFGLLELSTIDMSLEDIFIQLVTEEDG